MSLGIDEVTVGASLSSIVGCNPELSMGSQTSPNMEAMIRGGLQEAGVFVSTAMSRSVEFGMAAVGTAGPAGTGLANAGMTLASGISQAMQTMINDLSTPKR